jgi:F-type H+-transporting ATPase subunit b
VKTFCFIPAVFAAVFLCSIAHASGGEHDGFTVSQVWNMVFRLVNIALFIGIIWHFYGKKIAQFFSDRKKNIIHTLDDIERRKDEAIARLEEVLAHIANLEEERKAILEESRAQGESIKTAIIEDAKAQAAVILDQARRAAQAEAEDMAAEVREVIVEELASRIEHALARLGSDEHNRLIDSTLKKVVLQ